MMYRFRMKVGGMAFALLLGGVVAGPIQLDAQVVGPGPDGRWPLQPTAPGNHILAPFMEGWYENEDGTYTISFGYVNANLDTLYIPVGESNFLDPAEFNGMQPTVFFPGHQRGVFTATLPAVMRDTDVWWTLTTDNGSVTKVPGRTNAIAYQLDWYPRPHGSLPPSVSFEGEAGVGRGPPGIMSQRTLTVAVGSPLTLSVNATDPSPRDLDDFRNVEVPLRAVWSVLQGPGPVQYTRHPSNPPPEEQELDPRIAAAIAAGGPQAAAARRFANLPPPGPEVIRLEEGQGTASVIATFSVPGQYVMFAQVDNFDASDSSANDQCCWTNGYVRVNVTP